MKEIIRSKSFVLSVLVGVVIFLLLLVEANAQVSTSTILQTDQSTRVRVNQTWRKLPLSFEANQGQTDARVKFLSRGMGYSLFLTPTEAVLALRTSEGNLPAVSEQPAEKAQRATTGRIITLRMQLVGANPHPKVVGLDELPCKSNYFIGNDPKAWHTNVSRYTKVRLEDIYPGIDLIFYGNQGQLEYDFVVAPGADLRDIRLGFQGAEELQIDFKGALVIYVPGGQIKMTKPNLYQEFNGIKRRIPGRYILEGKYQVGLQVTYYDASRHLIIDPVLSYSTYLGGETNDFGLGIAVDSDGNAYVTGITASSDFPTENPSQGNNAGSPDLFVTKLNALGSALVFSTYLGGSGTEGTSGDYLSRGIAVDSEGNVYVTNFTGSPDFPTTPGAFQTSLAGLIDAFVTKLNPTGSALIYSTYIGGSEEDEGRSIALDDEGNAYVVGATVSNDFPTTPGAFQTIYGGGSTPGHKSDAFVTKLNTTGSDLLYSTYLGGSKSDGGTDIAVDMAGNAYVTGGTNSTDFPTSANAFQPLAPGGRSPCFLACDAFVTKLNASGSSTIYSTYLGGGADEGASGITIDVLGNVYVTGATSSTDFPTSPSAFQTKHRGCPPGCDFGDPFVTKLNATGSGIIYSTYVGGSSDTEGSIGIDVDAIGRVCVTGTTRSLDFPTTPDAFQGSFGGGNTDAFVTKLNGAGSALVYSTYLGGGHFDLGFGIALDPSSNIYVTGRTASNDFPTTPGAFQTSQNSFLFDAFVTKILNDEIDSDADGLPDILENTTCTDSNDSDTDDDGILDGAEDNNYNGVVDAEETHPCNIDTDSDAIQDGTELGYTFLTIGSDTNTDIFQPDMDSSTTTDPLNDDTDSDGVKDGDEDKNHNGRVDPGETDPNLSNIKAMPWILLLLGD